MTQLGTINNVYQRLVSFSRCPAQTFLEQAIDAVQVIERVNESLPGGNISRLHETLQLLVQNAGKEISLRALLLTYQVM